MEEKEEKNNNEFASAKEELDYMISKIWEFMNPNNKDSKPTNEEKNNIKSKIIEFINSNEKKENNNLDIKNNFNKKINDLSEKTRNIIYNGVLSMGEFSIKHSKEINEFNTIINTICDKAKNAFSNGISFIKEKLNEKDEIEEINFKTIIDNEKQKVLDKMYELLHTDEEDTAKKFQNCLAVLEYLKKIETLYEEQEEIMREVLESEKIYVYAGAYGLVIDKNFNTHICLLDDSDENVIFYKYYELKKDIENIESSVGVLISQKELISFEKNKNIIYPEQYVKKYSK